MSEEPKNGFTFTDAVQNALETRDTRQLKTGKALDQRFARTKAALRAEHVSPTKVSQQARRRKKGDGSVFLRGRIYWIKYSVNGEPVSESSGSDKETDARKLLRNRLGEIVSGNFTGPDAQRVTIAELADDVVIDYEVNE
jgi:hypothetical protein